VGLCVRWFVRECVCVCVRLLNAHEFGPFIVNQQKQSGLKFTTTRRAHTHCQQSAFDNYVHTHTHALSPSPGPLARSFCHAHTKPHTPTHQHIYVCAYTYSRKVRRQGGGQRSLDVLTQSRLSQARRLGHALTHGVVTHTRCHRRCIHKCHCT